METREAESRAGAGVVAGDADADADTGGSVGIEDADGPIWACPKTLQLTLQWWQAPFGPEDFRPKTQQVLGVVHTVKSVANQAAPTTYMHTQSERTSSQPTAQHTAISTCHSRTC
jgi:hypothetical protein